ncbi:MAG: hypothetical protein AMXMBFR33_11430 [Candidatus Xenobia bacterium]|jgi:protein involved in polysaccharide export with SLBB domain
MKPDPAGKARSEARPGLHSLLLLLALLALGNACLAQETQSSRRKFLASVPRRVEANPSTEERVDPLLPLVDPASYRLGPGDSVQLTLSYPGGQTQTVDQIVDPQGSILCYQLGNIRVGGLTLAQTQGMMRKKLGEYYKSFDLGLRLTRVRRFPIQVTGEVVNPGVYQANGVMGVAEALVDAGGFLDAGSMRRVALVDARTNKKLRELDMLRWLVQGDQSNNPTLMPGQLVVVPKLEQQVSLSGLVYEAGTFETLPGETLRSLMQLAGALPPVADLSSVQVGRMTPDGDRELLRLNLESPDSPDWSFALANGDQLVFTDRTLSQGRVLVVGELAAPGFFPTVKNASTGAEEVQRRGLFRLKKGQRLSDLVSTLGGPTPRADFEHAMLERTGPSGELLEIPVDLAFVMANRQSEQDLLLEDGDTLRVPPKADNVFVVGHAVRPGSYPYVSGYGVREYLALAGGTTSSASTNHGRLIRRLPGQPPVVWEMDLLQVMEEGYEPAVSMRPGDIIYIPLHQPFLQDILPVFNSALFLRSVVNP